MSGSADPLAKWRPAGQAPPSAEKPRGEKHPYQAYQVSAVEKRHLEIRLKFPEPAECPSYLTLTNVRGEWRMGLGVTLKYGNSMVVDIKGENLAELFRALKDWKAEWIQEFDPASHLAPSDTTAPFIKSITVYTTRPEEPPPVNERH